MSLPISFRVQRRVLQLAGVFGPNQVARWAASKFMATRRFPRPRREEELLTQGRRLPISNGTIAWSWGQGPKVILVHGWNGRGSQLGAFVRPLVDAGFEVIAWDGPSHGDAPGNRTNLGEFTRALLQTEKELGPFYAVIAHSFGASASVLSTKLGLNIQHLVLIACPCSVQDVFSRFTSFFSFSPRIVQAFQSIVEQEAGLSAADAQVHKIGAQLSVKALLIHDRLDKEIPYSDAQKISAHWPRAEFITTEGLGHRRILSAEEVIQKTVKFIRSGPCPIKGRQ